MEIIDIDEAFPLPKREVAEPDAFGAGPETNAARIADAKSLATDLEGVEMLVLPSHGGLDHGVQLRNGVFLRHKQSPPDRWAHAPKADAELKAGNGVSVSHPSRKKTMRPACI